MTADRLTADNRERQALNRVWRAFGCASNPDDFKPSVRDAMWGQVEELASEATSGNNRLARENRQLESALVSEQAKTAAAEEEATRLRRYERDNHHNARMCPYCTPDPADREEPFFPDTTTDALSAAEARALAAEATIAHVRKVMQNPAATWYDVLELLAAAPTAVFDAALAEARAGALEEDVAAERTRQVASGYTSEHDDEHGHWALAGVAMSYESRGRLLEALAVLRAAREAFDRARAKQEESSTTNGEPA